MSTICRLKQLVPKTTAFFLCDMQEKFASSIQYFPAIANVASRILKTAKILDMPVIVTEQYPKGLGHTVKEIGLQDYPELKPFEKTQFSMMIPDVHNHLKKAHPEVENVIICGIESHVCVQCTVQALLNNGYDVHVVADGCSSRTMVDRMYSLQRMKAMGAWLTTSESVILGLVGDAAHPKFKEVQKLIRDPAPDSGLLSLLPQIIGFKKLVPKTTAFFLCDMQEKFASSVQYFPEIVKVAARILKIAKILDVPVIVSEQYPKAAGHTVKEIGLQNYPEIKIFEKTQFSMMIPEVYSHLKKAHPEVENIIICGVASHACIQFTVQDLLNSGYDVHVLADGCSSRNMVLRMFSLQKMKAMGAWLTTSESVICELVGDSAHPKFKEIKKLIREQTPDNGLFSLLTQTVG